MAIIPLAFFVNVDNMSNIYCYKDWVVENVWRGCDGDRYRKKYFFKVLPKKNGVNYPGRGHQVDKEQRKFKITPRYFICWIGSLILQEGHLGSHKREGSKFWRQGPYGVRISYIQNTITINIFEFMRRFIHFMDTST